MDYLMTLSTYVNEGRMPEAIADTLRHFIPCYITAAKEISYDVAAAERLLQRFLDLVVQQLKTPFAFDPYHHRITKPIDYYQFGIDFIRPLVKWKESKVIHRSNVDRIASQLHQGDNAILFANHQTELDPQALSLLLEDMHPELAKEMIFVAGHRVVSDPLAVPFSMGRNLLCIYSKKYIDNDPEQKASRQNHNQRTINCMSELLSEGGKCIYVAPSGGRDRPDAGGKVSVAPFDPQSIELFRLIGKRARSPVHYYPLALSTYDLLPPPDDVAQQLGEERYTKATAIHLNFGNEIDMDSIIDSIAEGNENDKQQRREKLAAYVWGLVNEGYQQMDYKI